MQYHPPLINRMECRTFLKTGTWGIQIRERPSWDSRTILGTSRSLFLLRPAEAAVQPIWTRSNLATWILVSLAFRGSLRGKWSNQSSMIPSCNSRSHRRGTIIIITMSTAIISLGSNSSSSISSISGRFLCSICHSNNILGH
jgi:hypothetical protein